jgi:ParB family transcriptional regulator, chromosome partitioning protein
MTIAAEKKDEKVEKRRALGRGLESLLPGPRVVTPARESGAGQRGGDGGETKVPRFARDDRGSGTAGGDVPHTSPALHTSQHPDATRAGAPAPQSAPQEEGISIQAQAGAGNLVVNLDLALIDKNPYQTRYVFKEAELTELAVSIKEHGVVQPVVVRPAEEEGRYILVLGERRMRASKLAGKDKIPALVRRLSLQQAAEMTVLENVVRQDLNPLEQAEAFRVLSQQFNLTQVQIAQRIGVSRETVANYMRLLRLPQAVMQYMLDGQLSFSDAREILSLDNAEHIPLLAEEAVTKHLKMDEVQQRVRELNGFVAMQRQEGAEERRAGGARWMDPNVRAAQTEMERTLGMRVRIRDRNGKGKIVIEYATVDDYERVVEMFRGKK